MLNRLVEYLFAWNPFRGHPSFY